MKSVCGWVSWIKGKSTDFRSCSATAGQLRNRRESGKVYDIEWKVSRYHHLVFSCSHLPSPSTRKLPSFPGEIVILTQSSRIAWGKVLVLRIVWIKFVRPISCKIKINLNSFFISYYDQRYNKNNTFQESENLSHRGCWTALTPWHEEDKEMQYKRSLESVRNGKYLVYVSSSTSFPRPDNLLSAHKTLSYWDQTEFQNLSQSILQEAPTTPTELA